VDCGDFFRGPVRSAAVHVLDFAVEVDFVVDFAVGKSVVLFAV